MAMISVILRDLKEIIAPGGRVHVNNLFSVSILSEGILFASLLALFLFDISLLVKFRRGPYQHRNEPYNTFRYGLWELYSVAIPRILRTLILVVASWVPALTLSMEILYYIIGDQIRANHSREGELILLVMESGELQGAIRDSG
ncbi:hypothetical protein F4823DRAFT_604080 [Ustulina deusta]|nr:hypothetical protein F4823DRAFT_604080 [Ustulina deusta]